jgi:lipopolysaccharide/colanic/teichoic acid biosynthesis glycosyltransferase
MSADLLTSRKPKVIRSDAPHGQAERPHTSPAPTRYTACKPAIDFIVASLMLIFAAPVIGVIVLFVRLTSRGPGLYTQARVGLRGRVYSIYKIRTMHHDCERRSGPQWSQAGDPRVTRLGRCLRKTHLDELPQLWNVLRGEMSLVGPRPERPEFVPDLAKAIPHYNERLLVRPGVTGLAQVQLPADTDLKSVRRKLACDLFYTQRQTLWLDLRIVLATATKVVAVPFAAAQVVLRLPDAEAVRHAIAAEGLAGRAAQPRLSLQDA